MNSLRHIRTTVYRLKRNYGTRIVLVKSSQSEYNLETGAVTPDEAKYTIERAVVMPMSAVRKYNYGLTYIAVNKNFAYGANYERMTRLCLIDRADFADLEAISLNDYVEFRGMRWTVKEMSIPEHDQHALLTIQTIDGRTVE